MRSFVITFSFLFSISFAQHKQELDSIKAESLRRFLKDTSATFGKEWNRYIEEKYNSGEALRDRPRVSRVLALPLLSVASVLDDQGVSEVDFRKYQLYKRFDRFMLAGIEIDSLGYVKVLIYYKPIDPRSDSLLIHRLDSLGLRHGSPFGPGPGRIMRLGGYVSVFKLAEMASDTSVERIGQVIDAHHN